MLSAHNIKSISEPNHRLVMNIIRIYHEISGAEISRISGLQPSTIVYILRRLERNGIIRFSRTGASTLRGGKKPNLWQIIPGIGKILGTEILGNKIRYVIIDFAGNLIEEEEQIISGELKGENIVRILVETINKIFNGQPVDSFLGVCLGVPGMVDTKNGIVHHSSLLSISNCNLALLLQEKLRIPVYIINDANAGALSIKWFYKSTQKIPENIIYLTYNNGSVNLGSGIIVNHQLYHGASGFAGEIFRPLPSLYEIYTAGTKEMGEDHLIVRTINPAKSLDFQVVCKLAQQGCELSAFIVNYIVDFISDEIVRLTGLLNPDQIVLGGDITCSRTLLEKHIIPTVKKRITALLKLTLPLPRITFSEFREFSVSMGAAAYILSTILEPFD